MSRKRIAQAARRFKSFHGVDAESVTHRKIKWPKTVTLVGSCSGVLYITPEGEQYIHKFRPKSRPQLAVSSDGKMLVMLGGAYQFTYRGIVDR